MTDAVERGHDFSPELMHDISRPNFAGSRPLVQKAARPLAAASSRRAFSKPRDWGADGNFKLTHSSPGKDFEVDKKRFENPSQPAIENFDNTSKMSVSNEPAVGAGGAEDAVGTPVQTSSDLFDRMAMVSPEPELALSEVNEEGSVPSPTRYRRPSWAGALDPNSKPSISSLEARRNTLHELPLVFCESRARIPTTSGTEIFLHLYRNNIDNKEHLAIVFGEHIHSKSLFERRPGETEHDRMTRGAYVGRLYPGRERSDVDESGSSTPVLASAADNKKKDTLVRIHSECYTGETAWSARCDCGEQLDEAGRLMALEGSGVIVYLRQEGRGIGLGEKLKAYNLQDLGADTVTANLMLRHPADARSFSLATAILEDLGQSRIRLMTNNPDKIVAVEGKHREVQVTERVPMVPLSWQNKGGFHSKEVDKYLETKINRMGHLLEEKGKESGSSGPALSNFGL